MSPDLLEQLNLGKHLAWIYSSPEQRTQVAVPFAKQAFEEHAKCLAIASPRLNDILIEALKADGVDIESLTSKGQFASLTAEDLGISPGYFDPDSLVHEMKKQVRLAKSEGWQALFIVSDASTLLAIVEDKNEWIHFEGLIEQRFFNDPIKVLCQYDSANTPGDVLATVLKIHPVIGLGQSLGTNPFYVDPSELVPSRLN